MNLRPHHILCIQKFTGHGYDEGFTEHMMSVVSALSENKDTAITVIEGCDILCRRCPNNDNGVCTSPEKVALMDRDILEICGLSYGENFSWRQLAAKGSDRIFNTDKFYAVCSSCQWFELCRDAEI